MKSATRHLLIADLRLVLGALALGLVYNAVNPAGIHWGKAKHGHGLTPTTPGSTVAPPAHPYGHAITALWVGDKPMAQAAADPFQVEWAKVRPLIERKQKFFVDIRPTEDYQEKKIEGALSFPLASQQTLLPLLIKTISADKSLVVGCIKEDCSAAKQVVTLLRSNYPDVTYVTGPDPEWDRLTGRATEVEVNGARYANRTVKLIASNSPVLAPAPTPPPPVALSIPDVTWPQIKDAVARGEAVLLDGRTKTSFDHGHIPGAINLPYTEMLQRLDDFKKTHPPDTRVITYCANAKCPIAYRMAVVLKKDHGYTQVQHMPGGFYEWRQLQN